MGNFDKRLDHCPPDGKLSQDGLISPCQALPATRRRDDFSTPVIKKGAAHGPTIDRPPFSCLGGRPPGLRADPVQRPQDPGLAPTPCARSWFADLYYPVGSFDEPAGKTGLAHFVEHMLFKGTERFPKGQIDRLAFVAAGQSNAETGEDSTHYWFAFPSARWELALAIESDRMRGATFDPREIEAERQVIAEERARDQESPSAGSTSRISPPATFATLTGTRSWAGPMTWLRIDAADLKAFYHQHYRPDGAVLVIVGDVDAGQALDASEARFASIARGEGFPPAATFEEPRQAGRRDFSILEPESVARGLFGWHTVTLGHPDGPALDVLSDLLTCGRRSRLWDQLVETEKLATWVETGQEGAKRAGQFLLQVESVPGAEPERIEQAIARILADLSNEGPTASELERSRNRLEAAWRWEQEDLAGLAGGLGLFALNGDWRAWQAEHRAALAVQAEDIRRVASAYLNESNLTVGWSLPRPSRAVTVLLPGETREKVERPPLPTPVKEERPIALEIPSGASRLIDYAPRKLFLPNGMRLLTEHRPGTGVVALELFVDSGLLREAKPGQAYLTGRMLEEGTTSRSADAMAEAIEDVGGALEVSSTGASLRVRAEDLPLAIEWLADLAIRPSFPAEALAWTKRKIAAELQSDRDDPTFRADLIFRGLVYGDHPYARDPRGTARETARLTLEDVLDHHSGYFQPENAFLVAVGEFDPRKLQSLVKARFGSWMGAGRTAASPPRLIRAARHSACAGLRIRESRFTYLPGTSGGESQLTPILKPWPWPIISSGAGLALPTGSVG